MIAKTLYDACRSVSMGADVIIRLDGVDYAAASVELAPTGVPGRRNVLVHVGAAIPEKVAPTPPEALESASEEVIPEEVEQVTEDSDEESVEEPRRRGRRPKNAPN